MYVCMYASMHAHVCMYGWMDGERKRERKSERKRERKREKEREATERMHYWHAHKYRHILAYLGGAVEGKRNLEPEKPDDS